MAVHFNKPELEYLLLFVNWISIAAEIRLLASMNKLENMGFFDDRKQQQRNKKTEQQNNEATKEQNNESEILDRAHNWEGKSNGVS
jgi:hypothetical protein